MPGGVEADFSRSRERHKATDVSLKIGTCCSLSPRVYYELRVAALAVDCVRSFPQPRLAASYTRVRTYLRARYADDRGGEGTMRAERDLTSTRARSTPYTLASLIGCRSV